MGGEVVAKLRLSSCNQNEWHFIRIQTSVAITILLVQLNSPIERKRQRERERKKDNLESCLQLI